MRTPRAARTPELAALEATVIRSLDSRDFTGAARAVIAYEAAQPVPRGINVDWTKVDPANYVPPLTSIYGRLPADCAALNPLMEGDIKRAAALMFLFGVSKPYRRWLARGVQTNLPFTGDQIGSALVIRAYNVQQNAAWDKARAMGIRIPDSYYREVW